MRVTFSSSLRTAAADIIKVTEDLAKHQRAVTSGKRIHAPSDDPAATLGAVTARNEIGVVDQYVRTGDSATARLTVVDTVLSEVLRKLEHTSATLITAQGSVVGQTQRDGLVAELTSLRDALFTSMTTQFRGAYLFSGTDATTAPYTKTGTTVSAYAGNNDTALVDVDRQNAVQVTWDGDALMRGTAATDLFTTFEAMITAVDAGDSAGMATAATALNDAFIRVSRVQSQVGTDLAALDDKRLVLDTAKRAATAQLSAHEDANMVDAITKMTQAEAAYEAALTSTARIGRQSLLDYLR